MLAYWVRKCFPTADADSGETCWAFALPENRQITIMVTNSFRIIDNCSVKSANVVKMRIRMAGENKKMLFSRMVSVKMLFLQRKVNMKL